MDFPNEIIMDQRRIQKKGGLASRYPTSWIIAQFLQKYNFQNVLDVTYGVGRFYKIRRPSFLVGADPVKRDWVIKPDIFFQKPVWSLRFEKALENYSFDVLVVDPPWGLPQRRKEYSDLLGTPQIIIDYALKLARERCIKYVLVHYNKILSGIEIVENIGFKPWTRYLNIRDHLVTYFTLYRVV